MRTGGAKKRRDSNEKSIVDALRKVCERVERISGPDLPDLLAHRAGLWYPMEVKTAKGGFTKRQQEAESHGKTPYPVVRSIDDALKVVGLP